jgi:acylphosphatase
LKAPLGVPYSAYPVPDTHHETAFFTGRVQGVGFRYAALQVAREFEVAGYVANLSDGRVQLEAEGRQKVVEDFIAAVTARMDGYVRTVERRSGRRRAQFTGFVIQ